MPVIAVERRAGAAPAPAGYPPTAWSLQAPVEARRLSPPGISLWLYEVYAPAGSVLRWDADHGDEAVYIASGLVEAEGPGSGRSVPEGGAVVVEAGAPYEIGVIEDSRLLHFGPADPAPPSDGPYGRAQPASHGAHAVGPGGVFATRSPGRDTRFYADSSCPTCRITLMLTSRDERYVSEAHSHSQDELIHLLSGEITVGRETLTAGDTLFVAADRRYTFTSGDTGFAFLNYRRDASFHTPVRGGGPALEGGAVHGFTHVADLR